MGVNRVEYGGNTLIDISNSTVTADTLAEGVVAYGADGEEVVGTMAVAADFVVERGAVAISEGSGGGWLWEKWNSGKAVCYGFCVYSGIACTTAFTNVYRTGDFSVALPTGLFSSTPYYVQISSALGWINRGRDGAYPSTTSTGSFNIVSPNKITSLSTCVYFLVIHKWKE